MDCAMMFRMRYLGIDYGKKRVGLALSDVEGKMAFPSAVVANNADLIQAIDQIVKQEAVAAIVIGHSKHTDGSDNQLQTAIETFITDLTLHLGLPVHLEPEQYSTQEAKRVQGKTDMLDAAAAAVILNSYLYRINPQTSYDE